jgi:hypothetical protein
MGPPVVIFGEGVDMAVARPTTSEWTLWVVAVSCALHAAEEYFSGWQKWALETLGIAMPTTLFMVANTVLVIAAVVLARVGWRRSAASLVVPAATFMNAILFHILPSIVQHRLAPGFVTAALLYVPFSTWAYVAAWRDGVPRRALLGAFVAGTLMMLGTVMSARYLVTNGGAVVTKRDLIEMGAKTNAEPRSGPVAPRS